MTEWSGAILTKTLRDSCVEEINAHIQPYKEHNWQAALATAKKSLVNKWQLGDSAEEFSGWTPLHHAAAGNAPPEVAQSLLQLGAFRSLRDAKGRTAEDVGVEFGAGADLLAKLKPRFSCQFDDGRVAAIESQFHRLIREVAGKLVDEHRLWLPQIRVLLEEGAEDMMHFQVPGMYGGFYSIHLEMEEGQVSHLLCDSWCRVVGGSGRRDKVTPDGFELLESGFV